MAGVWFRSHAGGRRVRKGRLGLVRRSGDFYIGEEVLDELDALALAHGLSLSALLDQVLRGYLEGRKAAPGKSASEKRRFRRRKVLLPAMVFEKPRDGVGGRYYPTTIVDISIGGMRLSVPMPADGSVRIERDEEDFEVIFSLAEDSEPIRVRCRPQRVDRKASQLQVGAAFSGADADSHEQLQHYLM